MLAATTEPSFITVGGPKAQEIFGGTSRLAYHGVIRTLPDTGDPGIGLSGGRLNITLRESGLT